jgi:dephospho-CoA kinase
MTSPFQLGVTGGVATGKSTVAGMLEELGASVVDFDVLSRLVVEPERPAWRAIVAYFGEEILASDQGLDRQKLRNIVFQDPQKRTALEQILHPEIWALYRQEVQRFTEKEPHAVIAAIIPLLFEGSHADTMDKTLVVYASQDIQLRRLMSRDSMTQEKALAMIQAQMPTEEKRDRADFTIDNTGTIEATRTQVLAFWADLTSHVQKTENLI